jgi:histidinol dehydrogenase
MNLYRYPAPDRWSNIAKRPTFDSQVLEQQVAQILKTVREKGDDALRAYSLQFDKVSLTDLSVSVEEIAQAQEQISPQLRHAIMQAAQNIAQFHRVQSEDLGKQTLQEGVVCWRKSLPIERVGLYIPGGTAPLFSTVLMLGVPAMLAGCTQIVLCTPANAQGNVHPAILFAAAQVGITQIFRIGGAQAIAAMGYGTQTVPSVYKIFGPGNQYVTAAKQLLAKEGIAIDMPAGPSEVLVMADKTANPAFVAADLLSQAEHGKDSQVILLTTEEGVLQSVLEQVERQLDALPRKEVAQIALANSAAILLSSIEEMMAFSNLYAPEHLILSVENPHLWAEEVKNAGSVFLGNYSPESVGDYASGTNHTLPTNGFAKAFSGVSLDSFVKKITFQDLTYQGLEALAPIVETMAEAEQLFAHRNAVSIRRNTPKN